ncbi:hypothetical protein PDIDSM_4863 [Penicillium digitatum]|nr:hypothetical protein PDIDSM_4863 [Penicillium digitatum]
MASLSLIATSMLLVFITYRLVFWRGTYARYIGYNQYIILIYNLVLADFQQSLAFIICIKWILEDKVQSGSTGCFLQGLWLQIGDPGSGLFVFAIAFHTLLLVVWGRKMSHKFFICYILGVWGFVVTIVIIPIALHGFDVFVPSGAWCWINDEYKTIRLWTHYFWIFVAQFGTVAFYAVMFFQLRRQMAASAILGNSQLESLKRLRRVVGYMTTYPIVYIILSMPLAAGRMAAANGNPPSATFFCFSGAIITSSGLVDVIMYTLTRRNLILDSEPNPNRSYNIFTRSKAKRGGDTQLNTITVDNTRKLGDRFIDDFGRHGSTDNIVPPSKMGRHGHDFERNSLVKVYQETTIEITHEPAYSTETPSQRSSKEDFSPGSPHSRWLR